MRTEVTMLPVSAGDATLILWADGGKRHAVLIDAGLMREEALSYLRLIGISHLDLIILSHPDTDHLGGLRAILECEAIKVDRIWCFDLSFLREFVLTGRIPRPRPGTREIVYNYLLRVTLDEFSGILGTAGLRGIQVLQVSEGYRLALGGLLLEVLSPPESFYDALGSPRALKKMLKRKWPENWTSEGSAKARPLSTPEQQERLTNIFEKPDDLDDELLLTDLGETSEDERSGEESAGHEQEPEILPWKMVGTLYNNLSIVVKVTILGGIDAPALLFPGDLSDWTTLILRQWPKLRADILKLPHHGSRLVKFNWKLVHDEFEHWIEHGICCLTRGRAWHSRLWSAYGPVAISTHDRDSVRFLKKIVQPAHLLVFPFPRHGLPSMQLAHFNANVIVNRIDRSPASLSSKKNARFPARV